MSDPQLTPPGTLEPEAHLDVERINHTFETLEARCQATFGEDDRLRVSRQLFFRFRRQVHELSVPVPAGKLTAADVGRLREAFEQKYEQIYGAGTSMRGAGIEINTFRVEGRVPAPLVEAIGGQDAIGSNADGDGRAPLATRPVVFGGEKRETDVYRGEGFTGDLEGPVILEFPGTTVVVGPTHTATVRAGEVVINVGGGS